VWIEELVVKEEFRGKGIGTKLMKELEKVAKEKKFGAISLNTKKFNLKFYEDLGFKKTGYVNTEKEL